MQTSNKYTSRTKWNHCAHLNADMIFVASFRLKESYPTICISFSFAALNHVLSVFSAWTINIYWYLLMHMNIKVIDQNIFINCFIIWFRDRLIQTLKMQVKTKHIEKRKMSLDYGNGDYQSLYIGNFQGILGPRWKISTVKFTSKVTCRFIQLHAFL